LQAALLAWADEGVRPSTSGLKAFAFDEGCGGVRFWNDFDTSFPAVVSCYVGFAALGLSRRCFRRERFWYEAGRR